MNSDKPNKGQSKEKQVLYSNITPDRRTVFVHYADGTHSTFSRIPGPGEELEAIQADHPPLYTRMQVEGPVTRLFKVVSGEWEEFDLSAFPGACIVVEELQVILRQDGESHVLGLYVESQLPAGETPQQDSQA